MKSDLIEVECQLHAETAKAILVSDDGDRTRAIWLPKSQVEYIEKGKSIVEITLPEWMAKERGLI